MALTQLTTFADALSWLHGRGVQGLATDSRRVVAGDAFIAWPGYANDARAHVAGALAAGAAACLVEAEGMDAFAFDDSKVAAMQGLKAATGDLANAFFGNPFCD